MSPLPQKTLTTRYVSLSLSLLLFLTFSDDTFSTPPSALFPEQVHHAVVPAQQHVPHVLQAGRARVRELPAAHGGGHETLHQNVSSRHPRTPLKRFPRLTSLHFISLATTQVFEDGRGVCVLGERGDGSQCNREKATALGAFWRQALLSRCGAGHRTPPAVLRGYPVPARRDAVHPGGEEVQHQRPLGSQGEF